MKYFKIQINSEAYQDIQEGVDCYNKHRKGLGKEFHIEVKNGFEKLKYLSFFQIRYDQTRCLPLKRFPFMIHYNVDENKS